MRPCHKRLIYVLYIRKKSFISTVYDISQKDHIHAYICILHRRGREDYNIINKNKNWPQTSIKAGPGKYPYTKKTDEEG